MRPIVTLRSFAQPQVKLVKFVFGAFGGSEFVQVKMAKRLNLVALPGGQPGLRGHPQDPGEGVGVLKPLPKR